jgi:hypothetical protein
MIGNAQSHQLLICIVKSPGSGLAPAYATNGLQRLALLANCRIGSTDIV